MPDKPDAIHRLNETFFQTSPGAYLRSRAYALMTEHPTMPPPSDTAAPPYRATHKRVKTRLGATATSIDHLAETALPTDRGDTTHALAAFILSHHANESLVRNLLAFVDSSVSDSPWLHLSGRSSNRRSPQFSQRVHELLNLPAEEFLTQIKKFTFGAPEILDQMRESGGDPEARTTHVAGWVRHCALKILRNANAYNAAKHGLASTSSFSRISFVIQSPTTEDLQEEGPPLSEEFYIAGPTIETLEIHKNDAKNKTWRLVDRVVDPIAEIASTLIVAEILDASWEVGRGLYLKKSPITVSHLAGPTPAEVDRSETIEAGVFDRPLWVEPLSRPESQEVLQRLVPSEGVAGDVEPVTDQPST